MGTKSQIQKEEELTFRWVNEKRVVEITGIALQTLRNQRFKGTGFPHYKIGRSVRYRLNDIIAFMEQRRVEPHA